MKLSFFIKHKLGIRAVLFVGANEQKIDIRDDAEAGFLIELAFKLIAEICFAVVKEFCALPVRERILKINIFPDERV